MKRLEVVPHQDADWIAGALDRWDRTRRMSLRGATPSPYLLRHLLEDDVAVQQVVWVDDDRPAGLLQVTAVSDKDAHGRLDLLLDPDHDGTLGPELADFVSEALESQKLRKLCVWALADELDVPVYLGARAHQVGRLVGHERRGPGDYADTLVYEIWKDEVA